MIKIYWRGSRKMYIKRNEYRSYMLLRLTGVKRFVVKTIIERLNRISHLTEIILSMMVESKITPNWIGIITPEIFAENRFFAFSFGKKELLNS